ncbi:MAG: PAS domain S-box protein [Leptolyngbya sp. SIO1E4]|nr:PAS domain S-box protein [Leptolyngbya sp. SIO1E4]
MANADPTVLLLLNSSAERARCRHLLGASASWQGTLIEVDWAAIAQQPVTARAQALTSQLRWAPDVVLLDRQSHAEGLSLLQKLWGDPVPAFGVLLEDADETLAATILKSGVLDYLVKSQLTGLRLSCTLRNLWQQHQLQQELATCKRQDAFRQVAVGINQADESGQFIQVNQRFCDMLGYSEAELLQLTYQAVTHPDDLVGQAERERQLFSGEVDAITFEKRYVAKAGHVVWTRVTLSVLQDETSCPASDLAIIEDISDRKRLEQDLRDSKAQLSDILNSSKACIASFRLLSETVWKYDYISPASEWVYGYPPDELMGRSNLWDSRILPEDIKTVILPDVRAIIQGQTQGEIEYRFRHRDGSIRWINESYTARRDEVQDCWVVTAVTFDITDRKRIETQLRESEAELRGVFEAMDDVVLVQDRQGQYLKAVSTQPGKLYRPAEEVVGRTLHDIFPVETADTFLSHIHQVLETQATQEIEYCLPIGEAEVWFSAKCSPIATDQVIWVARDISHRKRAEEALRHSEHKHRALVSALPDLIIRMSGEGIYLDLFDAGNIAVGAGLVGRGIYEQGLPPDLVNQRLVYLRQALTTGELQIYEQALANGEAPVTEEVRIVPSGDNEVLVIVRDISDRKRADLERLRAQSALEQLNRNLEANVRERTLTLQTREQELQTIFNSAAVGIVQSGGNTHRILKANQRFCDWLGYSAEALSQITFFDLTYPEDVTSSLEAIQQLRQGSVQDFSLEKRYVTQDGSLLWAHTTVSAVWSAQGTPQSYIAVVVDITERKQAELALQESEERFRTLFEATPNPIQGYNEDRQVIFWNRASEELYGYSRAEALGKSIAELIIPEEIWDEHLPVVRPQTAHKGEPRPNKELKLRNKNNDPVDVYSSHVKLTNLKGGQETYCIDVDLSDRNRAEQALAESEERLRLALIASKQGLYDLDLRTGNVIVSSTYATMLGHNPANFQETYLKWLRRLHPDDRERVHQVSQAYLAGEIPHYEVEFRMRTQDGRWKWLFSIGKIVAWDQAGCPVRVLGTHTDIDERKQAEDALRSSEERFRQIAENITDVFWLTTPQHQLLYISPAYEQVWGSSPDNLDIETFLSTLHPDDRDQIAANLDDELSGNYEVEYRIVRPDGEIRWIRDRAVPVYDEQGQALRIAGVATDITERKRLEQEQARLLTILEASSDYVGITSPEGTAIWLNQQLRQLQESPPNTDFAQIPLMMYHPQWAWDIVANEGIPTAIREGVWIGETALRKASGETIPVSQLIMAHTSADGRLEYLSTIMRDISDIKQAEQALRRANADLEVRVTERTTELVDAKDAAEAANRAKSIFLANMSHELRTPLNAILGFSQLMTRDGQLSSKHLEALRIINTSGEHLLTLINDILEMSKIEAGRITLNPVNFSLPQLLNTVSDMLKLKAESKGLTFAIAYPPQLPTYVQTDSHKLQQVLINLLSNAIKFTQIGQVVLRVEPGSSEISEHPGNDAPRPGRTLRFTVEDTGCGIAPEELDVLFDPFVQTTSGRLSQEGTGLGLSISRQFVRLMGGELTVKSQLGGGAAFMFEIPIAEVEATAIELSQPRSRAIAIAPHQPAYRILIVEDNSANRALLRLLLIDLGFEVQTAPNGHEGLSSWQNWHPDLVFMDIRMPGMDGYETTRQIRAIEAEGAQGTQETATERGAAQQQGRDSEDLPFTPTKIIALTASVFEDGQTQALAAGCDAFMQKPIQAAKITQILAEHLDVRYRYASDDSARQSASGAAASSLTLAALQTLPHEWILQFRTAIARLDLDRMLALIAEIPPNQADLAQTLTQKVENFDYEMLLDLSQAIIDP